MDINFTNPVFLIPLTTGVIFILTGLYMKKYPPKKMNILCGYRTSSSMRNQARWDFAQLQAAFESILLGVFLSLTSIIGFFYHPSEFVGLMIGMGLALLTVVILIFRVERAISKNFR